MPLNPLDLRGPEFLFFYVVLATSVILLVALLRRAAEGGEVPSDLAFDPYLIAYLRGGREEAIHVAALSLLDRGLIEVKDSSLRTSAPDAANKVRRPLDRAVLERLAEPASAADLYETPEVQRAADTLRTTLERLGLLPAGQVVAARLALFWASLLLLAGLAVTKLLVAFSRGHYNVLFLLVLCVFAMIALFGVAFPRVTARGATALRGLRTMFTGLRQRGPQAGGATNELALLAAIFGFSGLTLASADGLAAIAPPRRQTGTGSCSGSSCGSSSGGGSSCGGGCGGGCGGCG
jgi:uncharacterized protein (TIGR04222 family)